MKGNCAPACVGAVPQQETPGAIVFDLLPLSASTDATGELIFLIVAALVGGYTAYLLRAPLVVGYLVGGLIVGPSVSNLVSNVDDVAFVGELGIALLLFTIGLEFPLQQFARLGRTVYLGGLVQIAVLGGVGFVIAQAFGLSAAPATLVASAVALSSTALLVRILATQPNRRRADGRWVLGIALVQDLVAVPLLVVIPLLGQEGTGLELVADVFIAIGKGLGLIVAVLLGGRLLVPPLLRSALATRSRELFLMSVFALAGGVALGSIALGISAAFGGFLAGLVTAQSPYAARALHELIPLRDLFAATFFVSVGVLFDITVVGNEWDLFVSLLVWGIIGKVLLIILLARWAGFDMSRALRMGLLLGQVGEFAFLFVAAAADTPANEAGQIIVAVGAASLAVSAALIRFSGLIERGLLTVPAAARRWTAEPEASGVDADLRQHTVICGYGRTGRELARTLKRRGFQYLVIDSDPHLPQELDAGDIPYVWGDLANTATLDEAHLETARVLALTIPDAIVSASVVQHVRALYPRLDIIVRIDSDDPQSRIHPSGPTAVVRGDLEVGMEMTRHTLHRYGIDAAEISWILQQRRREMEA